MQVDNWDDLKVFLALHRSGTLRGAARTLQVNETTVARRLARLEQAFDTLLFRRLASGRLHLTERAALLLPHAEQMELAHEAIHAALAPKDDVLSGTVRISAVPLLINRMLIPHAGGLRQAYPKLQLDLTADADNIDLSTRAADIALRFGRPTKGGLKTKAQKLATLEFVVAAPLGKTGLDLPWLGYDDDRAGLPQALWIETEVGRAQIALRVSDLDAACHAARQGLGQTLLPAFVIAQDPGLHHTDHRSKKPLPQREVWMLTRADQDHRRTIKAVKDWLRHLPWNMRLSV